MTEPNPYDFLSGDEAPSLNGSAESLGAAQAVAEKEPEIIAPIIAEAMSAAEAKADDDFSDSPYSALEEAEPDSYLAPDDLSANVAAYAPPGAVPREDSVAALAAQEAHRQAHESNGFSMEDSAQTSAETIIENHTNGRADYESSYDHLGRSAEITAYESVPEPSPQSDGGAPPPPIDSERVILQPQEPVDPNSRPHDEMDIWSHLGELRSRMIKAILAVVICSSIAWNFVEDVQKLLLEPVLRVLRTHGIKDNTGITVTDPMQAFTTYFQLAVVAGVIASAPIVLWQMWRFIEPALTHNEKRYSTLLVPFSVLLFFLGCALGYYTSPLFFNFFLMFVPPGVTVLWTYTSVVTLLGKMLLVFGVCFQVPVITIFLNKTGVVSRNILIEYWRHVVVVIFTVVAIITPTWDPITMTVCALPPCILYALSIWLIKWL